MSRFLTTAALGLGAFLAVEGVRPTTARAQYAPGCAPPVTVSYYTPAVPVTSYYAPAPVAVAVPTTYSYSYYSAPSYAVPTVAYSAPVTVYSAPAAVYAPAAVSTTYYRPGLFRPRYVTQTSYYTPVLVR